MVELRQRKLLWAWAVGTPMEKLAEASRWEEQASLLAHRTTYSSVDLDNVEEGRMEQYRRTFRSVSEENPPPQALNLQMVLV